MQEMETKILSILQDIQPDFDFTTSVDFVDEGYLDSFDVITLVSELEASFHVSISALDILPENFASLTAIMTLVKRSVPCAH